MQKLQTWRDLLGNIIRDTSERQRIADELKISPITLVRWSQGLSQPRPYYLPHLLNTLPQYHEELEQLMRNEFAGIIDAPILGTEDTQLPIPSEFYDRVITALLSDAQVWSIQGLILQQALAHLDPHNLGMSITLALCKPASAEQKIRSLQEIIGRGTPPWQSHLENQPLLLGSESLAGYATARLRLSVNQDINTETSFLPVLRTQWEESAVACPLVKQNRVAGCLIVASNRVQYFTPARQELIQKYANVMVLACKPAEFYEQSSIDLAMMPPPPHTIAFFCQLQ